MKSLDKKAARQIVQKVLAADFSCEESNLCQDGTIVCEAQEKEGRRKFPIRGKRLGIVTMGTGTVISCEAERIGWVKTTLGSLSRDQIFSASTITVLEHFLSTEGQYLTGPDLKYVCSTDTFRPSAFSGQIDVSVALLEGAKVEKLYEYEGFRNALSYRAHREVLATVASQAEEIVGIAGASAESECMWQIGVDVVPASQGRGIGKALVSMLTEEILRKGKVPYYSTVTSNLPSRALATGIGYWPAWVELYARNKA